MNSEAFLHILSTIDQCLAFHADHVEYRESAVYLDKYRQCLTRALSLVKSFVGECLAAAEADIRARIAQGGDAADDAFTLYYGLYAAGAKAMQVKQLMTVVENRRRLAAEYDQCWTDCVGVYVTGRNALIRNSIAATIQQLVVKHDKATCSLVS